jgi:histone acetyltransferase
MDLGTVLRKISEEQYEHVEEFLDDTELIWDNCKTYNLKGSVIKL